MNETSALSKQRAKYKVPKPIIFFKIIGCLNAWNQSIGNIRLFAAACRQPDIIMKVIAGIRMTNAIGPTGEVCVASTTIRLINNANEVKASGCLLNRSQPSLTQFQPEMRGSAAACMRRPREDSQLHRSYEQKVRVQNVSGREV